MPRRRGRWIVLIVVAGVCLVISFVAFESGSPYGFLDGFHPESHTVEVSTMLPGITHPPKRRIEVLVFREEDSGAVLKALKEELTARRGFRAHDIVARSRASMKTLPGSPIDPLTGESWVFDRLESTGYASEIVDFCTGQRAANTANAYLKAPAGCLVCIQRTPSWLERQVAAIRKMLRL